MPMKKTNAARALERLKIPYDIVEYEVDENDLSAIHVATTLGQDVKCVFKTLVAVDENNRPVVACIAGDGELNLKALARAAGCKKCVMIPVKDILKLTGYVRGGCSPLGMKKQYPTFIDESALQYEKIYVSAGLRGMQLHVNPKDLQKACTGTFASLL